MKVVKKTNPIPWFGVKLKDSYLYDFREREERERAEAKLERSLELYPSKNGYGAEYRELTFNWIIKTLDFVGPDGEVKVFRRGFGVSFKYHPRWSKINHDSITEAELQKLIEETRKECEKNKLIVIEAFRIWGITEDPDFHLEWNEEIDEGDD